jgi:hypothetical protein
MPRLPREIEHRPVIEMARRHARDGEVRARDQQRAAQRLARLQRQRIAQENIGLRLREPAQQ